MVLSVTWPNAMRARMLRVIWCKMFIELANRWFKYILFVQERRNRSNLLADVEHSSPQMGSKVRITLFCVAYRSASLEKWNVE